MNKIGIPDSFHTPNIPMVLLSPQYWAHNTTGNTTKKTGATSTVIHFFGYAKRFEWTPGPTLQVSDLHLLPLGTRQLRAPSIIYMISSLSCLNMLSLTTKVCTQRGTTPTTNMMTNCSPCQIERGKLASIATTNKLYMVLTLLVVTSNTIITIRIETMHIKLPSRIWLGHLSFKMIKTMASIGLLTKRIATVPIPKCAVCMLPLIWRIRIGAQKALQEIN